MPKKEKELGFVDRVRKRVGDYITEKVNSVNPVNKLTEQVKKQGFGRQSAQDRYEAQERAMNRSNPYYEVPTNLEIKKFKE